MSIYAETHAPFNCRLISGVKKTDEDLTWANEDMCRQYNGCYRTLGHSVLVFRDATGTSTHAFVGHARVAPSVTHPQRMPEACTKNTLFMRPSEKGDAALGLDHPWRNMWARETCWDSRVQLTEAQVALLKAGTDTATLNAMLLYLYNRVSHYDGDKTAYTVPETLPEHYFQAEAVHPAISGEFDQNPYINTLLIIQIHMDTALFATYSAYLLGAMLVKQWGQHPLYIVARLCATLINNLLMPLLILLVCRVSHTKLSRYMSFDHNITTHKMLGIMITVLGLVHAVMHGLYHPDQLLKQSGVTGLLMLLCLTVLGLTQRYKEHPRLQALGYHHKFLVPHRLAACIAALGYAFHVPEPTSFLGHRMAARICTVYFIYLLDTWVEYVWFTSYTVINDVTIVKETKTGLCSPKHDNLLYKIKCPPHLLQAEPGQYAELTALLPEGHKFTIFNIHNGELTFLIKKCGNWTNLFYKLVCTNNQSLRDLPIKIAGPFGPSLTGLTKYSQILAIASGVGISSFGSYLNYVFDRNINLGSIKVLVSNNTAFDNFSAMTRVLTHAQGVQRARLDVNYYYTHPSCSEEEFTQAIAAAQRPNVYLGVDKEVHLMKNKAYDQAVSVLVHRVRMNIEKEIMVLSKNSVVVACGNPMLIAEVERCCRKYSVQCQIEKFT